MIITKDEHYQQIKKATTISMEILRQLTDATRVGMNPLDIDFLAFDLCKKRRVQSAFAKVENSHGPYNHAVCLAVNDEVVHGLPTAKRQFQDGDLISIDFGIILDGFYTDHCVTFGLGEVSPANKKLLTVGREAVLAGVQAAKAGNKTGDVGFAIEQTARAAGLDTVKQYIGHGIGNTLHDEPEVPATGKQHTGSELEKGMVICVEAQVLPKKTKLEVAPDGWTVKTTNGKNAVMFEYMIVVGENEPEILTDTRKWELVK